MKERLNFFLLLSCLFQLAFATILSPGQKKASVDSELLLFVNLKFGLQAVANSRYQVTGEFENGKNALAVDYHYPKNLLFWSTWRGEIYSCELNETLRTEYVNNVDLVRKDLRWYPESLAIDFITDRLYVLDTKGNVLWNLGLKGEFPVIIDVGARRFQPVHLEIDSRMGLIFLLDDGVSRNASFGHILRMNTDGSDSKFIDPIPYRLEITTGKMTLDRLNQKVLVSSKDQKKIFAIDYNGKILNTVQDQNSATSLSLKGNELFWVNECFYNRGKWFTDGSVYKCEYNGETGCASNSSRKLHDGFDAGQILAVRTVDPEIQKLDGINRTCIDEGRCKGVCLHGNCYCEAGFKLVEGQCQQIDEFLVYLDEKVFRGVCLDKGESRRCEPFIPFQPFEISFKHNERNGFDYDSTRRQVYYGSWHAIRRVNLDTRKTSEMLYQRNVFYGPMAIDPITQNLYYTEIEQRGNVSYYTLKVACTKADPQKSSSQLWELGRIRSLVVHPRRGFVYVTSFNSIKRIYHVFRMTTDASNIRILPNLEDSLLITIDKTEDHLYAVHGKSFEIMRSNIHGYQVEVVAKVNQVRFVTGLLVHGDVIYVNNRTHVHKFNKRNGEYLGMLDLFPYNGFLTIDFKVHNKINEYEKVDNPCAINNGGCDNFCFAVPADLAAERLTKTCKCYDGVKCKYYD